MAQLSYREAVSAAIAQEMRRDDSVVFIGEDIAAAGGVFKTTEGLLEEFGPIRVRDTPISEQAILGAAAGAAMTGLRPIAEIMFSGDSWRRSGCRYDWLTTHSGDHVLRLLCGLLGHRCKPDSEDPFHVRWSVFIPACNSQCERWWRTLRCSALAVCGKLGDGSSRSQGCCTVERD